MICNHLGDIYLYIWRFYAVFACQALFFKGLDVAFARLP